MARRQSVARQIPYAAVTLAVLLALGFTAMPLAVSAGAQMPRTDLTSQASVANAASTYVPLPPDRITDTRPDSGYPNAGRTLGPEGLLNIQVTGIGKVPVTGVTAVVINLTDVNPTASSYLTVFPEGATQPAASNLNFTADETVASLATVPLGSQGGVTIFNDEGIVNVVVDIEGYYTTTSQSGGLYDPVTPIRVLGSLAAGTPIGPSSSIAVTVAGVDGVPADASAVVANVIAAGSNAPGFLTVFPSSVSGASTPPTASNVNFAAGQVIGNRIIIPIGGTRQIDVYNSSGSVNVDVDLDGYYTENSGELGSAFTALNPARLTDTRVGVNGSAISAASSQSFNFLSKNIPTPAVALAANLTVVAGQSAGFLTVYPTYLASPPAVGDVNFSGDATTQSFVLMPLNGSAVDIYNSGVTYVNVIIDAFGYFAPPPPETRVSAKPSSIPADGTTTSQLTVDVTNSSGVAFDDPVTLTKTPSISGSCGSASLAGSTNASGQVTSTYTASTTRGTCTITATEANGGTTGSVLISQT
jgi:hypothetical protein